eukprot:363083-Chlamydomonas_euryale.AAC.14
MPPMPPRGDAIDAGDDSDDGEPGDGGRAGLGPAAASAGAVTRRQENPRRFRAQSVATGASRRDDASATQQAGAATSFEGGRPARPDVSGGADSLPSGSSELRPRRGWPPTPCVAPPSHPALGAPAAAPPTPSCAPCSGWRVLSATAAVAAAASLAAGWLPGPVPPPPPSP